MSTVLIDADILVYQVTVAGEEVVDFDADTVVAWADISNLHQISDEMIKEIQIKTNSNNVVLCFSDRKNFRKDVLPSYKENRSNNRKPIAYSALKKSLEKAYETFQISKLEGDDVIGILATNDNIISDKKIIYSIDKDLRQIPGRHWDFNLNQIVEVSDDSAELFHMSQVLTGDRTDNYFGCPGIGPKKAEAILDKGASDYWQLIIDAYEKTGLTEQDALVQAQVARICRSEDYCFKNERVILWTPKSASQLTTISPDA